MIVDGQVALVANSDPSILRAIDIAYRWHMAVPGDVQMVVYKGAGKTERLIPDGANVFFHYADPADAAIPPHEFIMKLNHDAPVDRILLVTDQSAFDYHALRDHPDLQ